jgi:hypothetical protein
MRHTVELPEDIELRLAAEADKQKLFVKDLIPLILAEYFQMWDDMESGAALLKDDTPE